MQQPKFRSYYRRLHHRAAVTAMQSLIAANPDHNTTVVAIQSVEFADALIKELKRTENPTDDEED